jgi:Family of unknown function (DUF6491)
MKHLIPAMGALLVAGAALATPAAAQDLCLRQNMVNGWKVVNDQTLIVDDRVGRQFTVSLAKGCHDLSWPDRLAFSADTTTSLSCIQRHGFVYVPANTGRPSQRCLIENVQPVGAAIR